MKRALLALPLAGMIILLLVIVPVSAETSTISSVTPAVGYQGDSPKVTIVGTDFNTTSVQVKLMKSGESNITASVSSVTNTSIVCTFDFDSDEETGAWDLVVINQDNSEVKKVEFFTINVPMKLTSITPSTARTNNKSVEVTIAGSGFKPVTGFYLYSEDNGNITGKSLDVDSATKITGKFDLSNADIDTYEVCIKDTYGTTECDLSFKVTTDEVGNIDVSSSPSGAGIYVDNDYKGTTPASIEELEVGSHKMILKKSGYEEWAKMVKVTADSTTTVDADLVAITTAPTAVPTVKITTATLPPTTVKSTKSVPTPWAAATTVPTTESPVNLTIIVGSIIAAIVILGRR